MSTTSALRLVPPWPGQDPAGTELADDAVALASARAPEAERPETAGAQTLRRGLAVLRLLTRVGPGGLRMGEIGHRLGLNKTTAIRLTRTLVDEGFVLHDRAAGRYRLGPDAFAVGLAAEPGDRWPLGVGAGSCAILAALPDETVADVLARNAALRAEKYPRCTDASVLALVRDTRERGYCLQPGMVFEDSWAIGVVVYDANQAPVASISIAALRSRLGPARSAMLGNRLMQASKELTAQMAA